MPRPRQLKDFDLYDTPDAKLIHLMVTHEQCARKWATAQTPAVEDFHPDLRLIASMIREQWKESAAMLTRASLLQRLEASPVPKLKHGATMFAYSNLRLTGTAQGVKPADFDVYAKAINIEAAKRMVVDAMDAAVKWDKDGDASYIDDALGMLRRAKANIGGRRAINIRSTNNAVANSIVEPPTIIDGLLRQGEIANVVSSPKMRKSWAMADLAFCAANGLRWLGRFQCTQTRTLVIDNELREWQLQRRYTTMRDAKGLNGDSVAFDYVSLRDDGLMDLDALCEALATTTGYGLIILDALYRFFPEGFDENSNPDFTRLYNTLDGLASRTGAAIVIVHHTSKGSQQGKATTDTGSGAGAQSRAADAHIVLKAVTAVGEPQDDAPDRATLTAVVRTFKPVDKVPLVWEFPFWRATVEQPEDSAEKAEQLTTLQYAERYTTEVWESRATIEARAKADKISLRESRELFDGAVAEARVAVQTEKHGRALTKLYRRPADAFGDQF